MNQPYPDELPPPPDYPDNVAQLKVPPHSNEAEQSVLGGLMVDPNRWPDVSEILTEDDFFRSPHRTIYNAMAHLVDDNQPIDAITLADYLQATGRLDDVGGIGYLAELANNTPSAANVRAYARAVRERAVLRNLILAGQRIADAGYNPDGRTSAELIDSAQSEIMALTGAVAHTQATTNEALKAAIDEIDRRFNAGTNITGLPTGFDAIDERTGGLQNADVILVAGRPSMGKTAFAMNIVEHAVLVQKQHALVFSMEMPRSQLMQRLISSVGRIPFQRVRSGQLVDHDWEKLNTAARTLKDIPLIIDDRPALTVQQIRATARAHHQKHPLSVIMVDYLQLARTAGKPESRVQEVSEISRNIKAMAMELDVPVIALCQLNRQLENRPNKRPVQADLRDAGTLEQDADIILMLYRDEVYNEDSPEAGICEVICRKFRNGQIGTDRLASRLEYGRFENLAPGYQPPPTKQQPKGSMGFDYD